MMNLYHDLCSCFVSRILFNDRVNSIVNKQGNRQAASFLWKNTVFWLKKKKKLSPSLKANKNHTSNTEGHESNTIMYTYMYM